MVSVIAHYRAHPDNVEQVRALLAGHARASASEAGCLQFLALNGQDRAHVASLLLAAAACMLAGAGLFALSQDVPFTTALYWTITTATTVGTVT